MGGFGILFMGLGFRGFGFENLGKGIWEKELMKLRGSGT